MFGFKIVNSRKYNQLVEDERFYHIAYTDKLSENKYLEDMNKILTSQKTELQNQIIECQNESLNTTNEVYKYKKAAEEIADIVLDLPWNRCSICTEVEDTISNTEIEDSIYTESAEPND